MHKQLDFEWFFTSGLQLLEWLPNWILHCSKLSLLSSWTLWSMCFRWTTGLLSKQALLSELIKHQIYFNLFRQRYLQLKLSKTAMKISMHSKNLSIITMKNQVNKFLLCTHVIYYACFYFQYIQYFQCFLHCVIWHTAFSCASQRRQVSLYMYFLTQQTLWCSCDCSRTSWRAESLWTAGQPSIQL